ncbi:MAG: hypothetical protein KDG50_01245 [Chromatiales bacterium]|nr:hypothetical protein [Chromatiales bacterium]
MNASQSACRHKIVIAYILVGLIAAVAEPVQAYDGWSSELSHAGGGALLAGGITYIADQYEVSRKNRAWIGFGLSSALGVIGELVTTGTSALDMFSHAAGSAIGAFVTDKWILHPVVVHEKSAEYVGVESVIRF